VGRTCKAHREVGHRQGRQRRTPRRSALALSVMLPTDVSAHSTAAVCRSQGPHAAVTARRTRQRARVPGAQSDDEKCHTSWPLTAIERPRRAHGKRSQQSLGRVTGSQLRRTTHDAVSDPGARTVVCEDLDGDALLRSARARRTVLADRGGVAALRVGRCTCTTLERDAVPKGMHRRERASPRVESRL
jgi:hypothetical protein